MKTNLRMGRFSIPTTLSIVLELLVLARAMSALPMWSRRYSVPCGYCHAFPSLQLTSAGADFFRRGHRIEGDKLDKDLTHYLSAHGEWEYDVERGQSTQFQKPEFHAHTGGAISSVFSFYVDANVNEDFEALYLQATKEQGPETYFTARAGKISPTIIRNYGNGLMASASTPLILTDTTLGNNPFTPARDSFGLDVGARWKALFVQAGIVNGEDVPGQAAVNNHKDFFATAEVALPDGLSGVGLYYYHGGYDLGDPSVAPLIFDRYERTGIFANFTRDRFRLAGAYLYGKDHIETSSDKKLHGYYVQADVHPVEWVVPFVRYDDVKTEQDEETDRVRKLSVGCSLQIYQSEIMAGRLVLEGSRRKEAGRYTNAALFNLLWAF